MAGFGATVGAGILAQGVTEILKGLSILVVSEIALAWGLPDELKNLKKTLDMILAVMVDAEEKQVKRKAVRKWLGELKDIAYEAEDILDELAYEVIRQREMTRKRDRVSNILRHSIIFRKKVARHVESINKKLNKHAVRKEELGLEMLELNRNPGLMDLDESSRLRELRELRDTDSIVDESLEIIGRDKDKSNIMKMLLHNDSQNQDGNIQVIPIVGMGGVGKTTLTRLIFNDKTVVNHFDLKLWVCVSDEFKIKDIFVKMIESINKDEKCKDVSNIDVIARQLQQCLREKKYLLVLDDVWNKKSEEWMRLKKPLLTGGSGSKILVTTRSEEVASLVGNQHDSYRLGTLDEGQSWSLFRKRTFGYLSGVVMTPILRKIGKKLVKKCGGLPLALIFLISLLRNKDENEWRIISKNKIWVQSYDEDEILPILKLSYDHLPSHLKQCFSYFSLFMKDTDFDRKNVISMWMAEGFLPQPSGGNNTSMEEVGNNYFKILLSNSFFQDVERDEFGQVFSFKMHDLVHDLANYVADDCECTDVFADDRVEEDMENIHRVRRLLLVNYKEEIINYKEIRNVVLHDKPKLRTLIINDGSIKKIENNIFDGTKRLRVLDLSWSENIEEISSNSMSKLKHLRYLNLSSTEITNLPKSVTRLFHLQTLDVRGCENLKELPEDIGKLTNLRHLYLPNDFSMSREIGQLTCLQTLEPINVGNSNNKGNDKNTRSGGRGGDCGIQILEGLNLLTGGIGINYLLNVTSGTDAKQAKLERKKNLQKIFLYWHTSDEDNGREDDGGEYNEEEAVLEALQPHPNLKMLVIDQYFGVKIPRWMGDPSCLPYLTILELSGCTKCEQVVVFGKLPSLKELKLISMKGIKRLGDEFYYNKSSGVGSSSSSSNTGEATVSVVLFPSLENLILARMDSLQEWVDIPPPTPSVSYSWFPCLKEIIIECCPNLRITPTYFPFLEELVLKNISERVAGPLITTNLNTLCCVKLEKISELRFLSPCLLDKLKVLRVIDCLDFQGFRPSEEEEGFCSPGHQNEEEERFYSPDHQNEEEGFTSPEVEEAFYSPDHQNEEDGLEEFGLTVLSLLNLPNLTILPDIRNLISLECLYIHDCTSFKPLPEHLACLSSCLHNLKKVEIRNVKEVEDYEW